MEFTTVVSPHWLKHIILHCSCAAQYLFLSLAPLNLISDLKLTIPNGFHHVLDRLSGLAVTSDWNKYHASQSSETQNLVKLKIYFLGNLTQSNNISDVL